MSSEPPPAERTPVVVSDQDIDDAIEACGGDARETIRALLVGHQLLEELLEAARNELSWGYVRGHPSRGLRDAHEG